MWRLPRRLCCSRARRSIAPRPVPRRSHTAKFLPHSKIGRKFVWETDLGSERHCRASWSEPNVPPLNSINFVKPGAASAGFCFCVPARRPRGGESVPRRPGTASALECNMAHALETTRGEVDALRGATVLEFGASWCPICQGARTVIDRALAQHPHIEHRWVEDG